MLLLEPTCKAPGYCSGVTLAFPTVENEDGCIKACFEIVDCAWYSFFPATSRCHLLETCKTVQEDCNDLCTHGDKACYGQGKAVGTIRKIMLLN